MVPRQLVLVVMLYSVGVPLYDILLCLGYFDVMFDSAVHFVHDKPTFSRAIFGPGTNTSFSVHSRIKPQSTNTCSQYSYSQSSV